jgi:hypothetical protein
MSTPMQGPQGRSEYEAPTLVVLGTLRELTLTGPDSFFDLDTTAEDPGGGGGVS